MIPWIRNLLIQMKQLYKISLSVFILIFTLGCQSDDLLQANFSLPVTPEFQGVPGHEMVTLTWASPTILPEQYILTWASDSQKVEVEPTTNNYEVKGLNNATSYKFSIQADYGSKGISGVSEIKLSPIDELDFSVLPGHEQAIVKWKRPNRKDVKEYALSWSPGGDLVLLDPDYTTYEVGGLENEVDYEFELNIYYEDGTTSESALATVVPGSIEAFLMDADTPRANEKISFSYNPTFLPESPTSWSWNFGDGTTSSIEDPDHTYTRPGIYEVTLTVTDLSGEETSSSSEIKVWGEKWSFITGADIRSSSPAIGEDGTIYIGSRDNNLYAINPDGTLKWSFATENGIDASPAIAKDGTIYTGSYDNKMYAINPHGTLKWSFTTGSNIRYSTPAIGQDGVIYFGSEDSKLYALNSDGSLKWEFVSGDMIRSTPALSGNGIVYVTSNDNHLYAVNSQTGQMKWSYDLGGFSEGGPSIDSEGTIFVGIDKGGSEGAVFALNPDGSLKWETNVLGRISVNVPIIANGLIYIGTKEGNNVLALNKTDGSTAWSFQVPGQIVLSNPAVDRNGNVYFGGWDNGFYGITSDGSLKYHFESGRVWSSPAIGQDGTLYFGSYDGKLYAVEMFAEGLAQDEWPMFGKNLNHTSN